MWPISPADSRDPRHSFPLRTNPPPMPVPTRMATALRARRAEPSQLSPRAPRLQSLPRTTGTRKRPSRWDPISTPVSAMLAVKMTRPASGSTTPGMAIPMAVSSAGSIRSRIRSVSMVRSTAATACSGPPSRGVVERSRLWIAPLSSTSEAWIFVPPTSTAR